MNLMNMMWLKKIIIGGVVSILGTYYYNLKVKPQIDVLASVSKNLQSIDISVRECIRHILIVSNPLPDYHPSYLYSIEQVRLLGIKISDLISESKSQLILLNNGPRIEVGSLISRYDCGINEMTSGYYLYDKVKNVDLPNRYNEFWIPIHNKIKSLNSFWYRLKLIWPLSK